MIWKLYHGLTSYHLGLVPTFLDEDDPRPAKEQIDANYSHGGGWRPFKGHKILPNRDLSYPGDPPMKLLAETKLREESILFYDCSWMAIVQPDGSYEIARID